MGVIFGAGYSPSASDQPVTHARIAHSANWLSGTVTASSTATDYFADGPDNSMTYEKWKPASLGAGIGDYIEDGVTPTLVLDMCAGFYGTREVLDDEDAATWELDFGGSNAVDYCCIAAHDMGTQGNSLQVQRYDSGSWTDMIPTTAIADNMPIFVIFTSTTDTKYRIRVSGGSAPSIGVIRFGVALQMPRPIYGGISPFDLARNTIIQSNISETGEFLGRTKIRSSFAVDLSWSNITAAWVRNNWRGFQVAAETEPFFVAWRPITFSEVAYAQILQNPAAANMGVRDLMSVSLSGKGFGYD